MHQLHNYIDQSPDALRLTLVGGDLDMSQFSSYAESQIDAAGVRVKATIIGASHVVSFDTGLFQIHEVFACVGQDNVPDWPLSSLVGSSVEQQLPGMSYVFTAWSVPWQSPEPAELTELIAATRHNAQAGSVGLVQDFPKGNLKVTPKTVITATADARHVVIRSAHSYPNVRGLVLSQSVLSRT